jgi:signal transduction histidine kinase
VRDPDEGLASEAVTERWQRLGDELAHLVALVGFARSARLIAVALVPVFFVIEDVGRAIPLYTALIGYVLVTSFVPRNRFLRAADLAVAAALVVATGGATLTFLPFLVVAVAGTAAHGGMVAGLAGGGMLTTVLTVMLLASGQLGALASTQLVPVGVLLPLLGVTVGAAAQIHAHGQARDRRALQEANRLLSALRELTDDLPGGLDATTVSAALVAEVRQLPGSPATVVYALRDGILQPVATHGVSRSTAPTLRIDQLRRLAKPGRAPLRTLASLPDDLQGACRDHRWWVAVGMYREHDLIGGLLVGVDDPDAARRARSHLLALADDGAVALQNAQLFDGTRERAVQAARTHLAGDLHDGAAQALAHLRMELELLARTAPDHERDELKRLSGVARSALEDLRATISGLRSTGGTELDEAIRRHIAHLTKAHGPRIDFSASGTPQLDATTTDEVLRVLQEALSNALRHARAEHIRVRLERDARALLLTVEDDGVGLDSDPEHAGGGVGLTSMRDRAERLDGELVLRPGRGGGTVVELEVPLASVSRPSRVSLPPTTQRVLPRGRRRASPGGHAPTHGEPEGVEGPASRQTPARPTSGT